MDKNIKDSLHNRSMYLPGNKELAESQNACLERLYDFNQTRPSEIDKREALLKEMFAEIGENCYIEPPFHANWGGNHVHFGNNVYANFNLTLVDDTHIYIGDYTMIGPNVTIATAGHPILPELREKAYQFNVPVTVGRNCWIGAGAILLPGVSVGDNSVIGAGSIVTKDIPSNVVAVGNPCRVLREITEHDKEFYFKNLRVADN
ncbi:sugar O-acetyltransferase [Terribacillus saccharophilus]|uniref:sugar O-acetyltransferase n=1 Tax=Terribacillus saccharophilus TaxID=361277 RepID=UPI003D2BD3FA